MNDLIKILELLTWLGGFLFIVFRFWDAQQTKKEKKKTKILYNNIWKNIDSVNLEDLPKRVINYLLQKFDKRASILIDIVSNNWLKKISKNWILFIVILFIAQTGYINDKDGKGVFAWIDMVFTLLMGTQLGLYIFHRFKWNKDLLNNPKANYMVFFVASFYLSFFITSTVLLFENISLFENKITIYIFFTNLVFDSFTILATFYILKYCTTINKSFIYILGIIIDIIVAGIFAFLSIYIVTLLTNIELNSINILNILLFKSKDGVNWSIDNWFWVIHSTFAPTLFYLSIIFLTIVGKIIILPISKILKKAGLVDKPHYLTANLFAFLGALSFGFSKFLTWYIR